MADLDNREERIRRRAKADEDTRREGRAYVNSWARTKGFADLDDMAEKQGVGWLELYGEHLAEFAKSLKVKRIPR
jgi:hypothetical protein